MKKLFLLDGYALVYRAYYALISSPRVTTWGMNTSAVFGFCNTLREVLDKESPTHIAVCFDPKGGSTFRHEMYAEYKAQRQKQPEDITEALPWIHKILDALRIPSIVVEGYEADDVIGTLAKRAETEGYVTFMMTPDKDYGQLVTDNILMYRPSIGGKGFELRTPQVVCDKHGIENPRQVIDVLALEGDASDNIPGCPGVGPKTAQKLIAEWGSVENILAHAGEIKGALGKKLVENAGQIEMSKILATIRTDVPVDVTIDSLCRREMDFDALRSIYKELEFNSFISRLEAKGYGSPTEAETAQTDSSGMGSLFDFDDEPAVGECEYSVVKDVESTSAFVASVLGKTEVGVATYGIGEEPMRASLCGVAFSVAQGEAVLVLLPEETSDNSMTQRAAMLNELSKIFAQENVTFYGLDIKRDMLLLRREGVAWHSRWFDCTVADYVVDPEAKHDLGVLAARWLNVSALNHHETGLKPWHPTAPLAEYVAVGRMCERADFALRLWSKLDVAVKEKGMTSLLNDVELPLIEVLADMEWEGVRIDASALAELSKWFGTRLEEMEQQAYTMAGERFNLSSPKQVGEVLFERMKIDPKAKRTAKGAFSTSEQVLEKYAAKIPLVDLILRTRHLRKLLSTYVDALPALVNGATGRIHTTYNQTVTATGRISSTQPNLQNIPIRSDDGKEIRRAFVADDGCVLMSADYSQIELRLVADLSADKDMIEAFGSDEDIHRLTAAKIYHCDDLNDVTDSQRRNAKTANFGIIYGISAFGLSERLGIPRSEAKELIEGYFATYPGVKEYIADSIESARAKGYVTTKFGRRRYLPDINSRNATVRAYAERNAVNAPIQGTAADIIKIAMITVAAEIKAMGLRSRMIMQVHDELVLNVYPDELETVKELTCRCMRNAYSGSVSLDVATGVAKDWLGAH